MTGEGVDGSEDLLVVGGIVLEGLELLDIGLDLLGEGLDLRARNEVRSEGS